MMQIPVFMHSPIATFVISVGGVVAGIFVGLENIQAKIKVAHYRAPHLSRGLLRKICHASETALGGSRYSTRASMYTFAKDYGLTPNGTLLLSTPVGVDTVTVPLLAPAGTLALISVSFTTVNAAAFPWKLTLVAPVSLFPRITTVAPTLPDVGSVCAKGPSPVDRLKIVPTFSGPPK